MVVDGSGDAEVLVHDDVEIVTGNGVHGTSALSADGALGYLVCWHVTHHLSVRGEEDNNKINNQLLDSIGMERRTEGISFLFRFDCD